MPSLTMTLGIVIAATINLADSRIKFHYMFLAQNMVS